VVWNILKETDRAFVLTTPEGKSPGNTAMERTGLVHIRDASVKTLLIALKDGITTPKVFSLGQNYPNPFNPVTRFNVGIPKTAEVNIRIYDLLGRRIATILNGDQNPGYRTVEWDGKDSRGQEVPTGIYFVRMSSDEFSATQKVLLMR
jgi:hypothetical protein